MSIQSVASDGFAERDCIGRSGATMQFSGQIAKQRFSERHKRAFATVEEEGLAFCATGLTFKKGMTSITVKLSRALKEKLSAEARLRGKSRSALVRESLERNLASSEGLGKKQSLLDMVQDLAGKGDSGIADLATNPKHLKGFGEWRE